MQESKSMANRDCQVCGRAAVCEAGQGKHRWGRSYLAEQWGKATKQFQSLWVYFFQPRPRTLEGVTGSRGPTLQGFITSSGPRILLLESHVGSTQPLPALAQVYPDMAPVSNPNYLISKPRAACCASSGLRCAFYCCCRGHNKQMLEVPTQ